MHKYCKKLEISSLHYLKKDFDSILSKSPIDVGRTNIFQMVIMTTGPPIACKPYPIPLKYQKIIDKEIWVLENAGCISKSLSPWAAQVMIVPKNPTP